MLLEVVKDTMKKFWETYRKGRERGGEKEGGERRKKGRVGDGGDERREGGGGVSITISYNLGDLHVIKGKITGRAENNSSVFVVFRLGSVKNISSKFYLRKLIRERLLWSIQNLTVYDKVNNANHVCLDHSPPFVFINGRERGIFFGFACQLTM